MVSNQVRQPSYPEALVEQGAVGALDDAAGHPRGAVSDVLEPRTARRGAGRATHRTPGHCGTARSRSWRRVARGTAGRRRLSDARP
jgi:hypothetical protein